MTVRWQRWVPDPETNVVYRAAWSVLATVVGVLAAVASVTVVDPWTGLLTLLAGTGVFVAVGVMWAMAMELPLRSVPAAAVVCGLGVAAFSSLTVLVGAWSLLLVPLVVLTAPRLVTAVRSQVVVDETRTTAPTLRQLAVSRAWQDLEPADAHTEPRTTADLGELSLRGLCRFWADSSRELATRPPARRLLTLLDLRAACLEEMCARDGRGYLRWIAAGGGDVDPAAYLQLRPSTPRHDAA